MDPEDEPVIIEEEPAPEEDEAGSGFLSRFSDTPYLIYGTLAAGAIALLLLLMIVWLSTDDGGSNVPLCLDSSIEDAQAAILAGQVRRADVLIDENQPVRGLTAIQLEMADGECRKLPEGADNRPELFQILGTIELYNQEGNGNVRVEYVRQIVPTNLLQTSTPIPPASPTAATPLPEVPSPVVSRPATLATGG